MSDYRIVRNEKTQKYRVERRGWFGWSFVTTPGGDDYLSFDSYDEACAHICQEQRCRGGHRRWKVVSTCGRPCTG